MEADVSWCRSACVCAYDRAGERGRGVSLFRRLRAAVSLSAVCVLSTCITATAGSMYMYMYVCARHRMHVSHAHALLL